jgi:galactoside O-acetyltransferase
MALTIYESAKLIGRENIHFGENVIIDDFVLIYARKPISIGSYVHIGAFSSISGGEEVVMEDFSGLSMGCRIFTGSEDFCRGGFGNPTIPEEFRNVSRAPVRLGRFAVIGANSVILPGVTVGEGATVGACSVVSRDLDPWGIYIGNRCVGQRNREGVLENYNRFMAKIGSMR